MLQRYKTILLQGEAEVTEKKSRFIACARPVETEAEALAFLEEIRKKNRDARHNCFAWQIGINPGNPVVQRASDDGEPSGTAGAPILDVLRGEDLRNTAVVVTRYFGGTLLGTGGLVRCYGQAAKNAVTAAGITEKVLYVQMSIKTDYAMAGKVQYEILHQGHKIQNTAYAGEVELIALCRYGAQEGLLQSITDITSAKAEINVLQNLYLTLSKEGE